MQLTKVDYFKWILALTDHDLFFSAEIDLCQHWRQLKRLHQEGIGMLGNFRLTQPKSWRVSTLGQNQIRRFSLSSNWPRSSTCHKTSLDATDLQQQKSKDLRRISTRMSMLIHPSESWSSFKLFRSWVTEKETEKSEKQH